MWTPFGGTTIQPALIHCVHSAPRVGFWGPWPMVDDLIKPHPPVWAWMSSCWKQADRLGFLPPLMVCGDGFQMLLGCGGVKQGGRQEQDRTRGQRGAHTQQFCGREDPSSTQEPSPGSGGLILTIWSARDKWNYHLFSNTKGAFEGVAPLRALGWEPRPALCVVLRPPWGLPRALTVACSSAVAERTAPSVHADRSRDPGQVHLGGATPGVHFGKKLACVRRGARQLWQHSCEHLMFLQVKGIFLKSELRPQALFLKLIFTMKP